MSGKESKILKVRFKRDGLIVTAEQEHNMYERALIRLKSILNPTTYITSVILGGLLLAPYYLGIRYFPDIDLKDFAWLTVVAAILGGGAIIVFGIAFVFPGLLWRSWIASAKEFEVLELNAAAKSSWRLWVWFGGPLAVDLMIEFVSCYWATGHFDLKDPYTAAKVAVSIFTLLFGVAIVLQLLFSRCFDIRLSKGQHFSMALATGMSSAMLAFVSITVVLIVLAGAKNSFDVMLGIGVALGFLYLINVLLADVNLPWSASNPTGASVRQLAIGGIATVFIFLVLTSGLLGKVSGGLVTVLGIGNVEDVSLVLTEGGKHINSALDIAPCRCKENPVLLRHLRLLSRLGNEYYVSCAYVTGEFADEIREVMFTLPKETVVSYSKEIFK
jgi:hypothetical protein